MSVAQEALDEMFGQGRHAATGASEEDMRAHNSSSTFVMRRAEHLAPPSLRGVPFGNMIG